MAKHWCYFLFMLWFSYLIVSSILLFARGFLLSKNANRSNTTCISISEIPCFRKESSLSNDENQCSDTNKLSYLLDNINSASSICLPQKSRIVFMIIDALRYDFAVFDENLQNPKPFQNKLPIVNSLLKQLPQNSRLYRFVADPPTTTMQRLKALTTGSLPTFIDAGSNFATNEINEDNIIDQLLRHNHSSVLIGDDTWDGLYPNRFLRKYPYPSFDVWDLDTVDYGVNSHLYPELKNNDWDLLVAHYLGVDHCGHRYGPDHPEMDRKLTEMNKVIEDIVNSLDSNTMLFVIGDHGMTETGNHGGDSDLEVDAALFVYSPQPLSTAPNQQTVRQVDLLPTMSAILGVSVPFSNLGTIILDSIPISSENSIKAWKFSLFYLWANVQQMLNYIDDYSKTSETFGESELKEIREKFAVLNSKLFSVDDELSFGVFFRECFEFLSEVRQKCEKVWIQFDAFSIARGLLLSFLSIFFVYMIVDGIPSNRLPEIFMSSFLSCSYFSLCMAVCVSVVLHYFHFVTNLISTIYFATGLVSQFMLVMLVIQNWGLITLNWFQRSRQEKILNLICRLLLILHLAGLFSNSFVVEESSVLLYLLSTLILLSLSTSTFVETKKKGVRFRWKVILLTLGLLLLIRISVYFWRCRDRLEQPWCYENNFFNSKVETTKLQWMATLVTLALFVTVTKAWLKHCGNLNGNGLTVVLLKYVPTVLVVCTSGYWVLSRLPAAKNRSGRPWQANALAWVVYALSALGILTTLLKPLCVYVLPRSDLPTESHIPHLFQKLKRLFDEPNSEEIPVLCGFGTAYSAAFLALAVYLCHLFALLAGDGTAPSVVVMFLAAVLVLILTGIVRLERATSVEQLFEIPSTSVMIWVMLCQYFFYGTGHQPSFPNIIWDSAFVGTSGTFTYNFIPGSLIILNTFSSQIFMGILTSLHIVAPFTLSVILPSFLQRNILAKENVRGEVLLYEHNGLMLTVAFTTSCKYLIYLAVRVFVTMLAATIHCRHMMIWKIFAPKLIFEAIGMFVSLAAVNLSFLILVRITSKVDQLVVSLKKRNS